MRYFELKDDVLIPDRWHLGLITSESGEEPRLRAGVVFHGKRLNGEIDREGRPLDFCLTSFAVPVGREQLLDVVFDISGQDIQRVGLSLAGHKGFGVLNALRVITCLDENHSTFVKWTKDNHRADLAGQYRMVTKLRLDETKIPHDSHVFRVHGWTIALVVSEAVKVGMEAVGCVGAKFVNVTQGSL